MALRRTGSSSPAPSPYPGHDYIRASYLSPPYRPLFEAPPPDYKSPPSPAGNYYPSLTAEIAAVALAAPIKPPEFFTGARVPPYLGPHKNISAYNVHTELNFRPGPPAVRPDPLLEHKASYISAEKLFAGSHAPIRQYHSYRASYLVGRSASLPPTSHHHEDDDTSPRTTIPAGSTAGSPVSLGEQSPAVAREIAAMQGTFRSRIAPGRQSQADGDSPNAGRPGSPGGRRGKMPDCLDYMACSIKATQHYAHVSRIKKWTKSIVSDEDVGPLEGLSLDEVNKMVHVAMPNYAAPPPVLPQLRHFKDEESFFGELRSQLWETDQLLEQHRAKVEAAMKSVLGVKTMLSDEELDEWKIGYCLRKPTDRIGYVQDRIECMVLPVIEDINQSMLAYGEALARRKRHLESQLAASRTVLALSMETEALKRAQAIKVGKDAWEGADRMLNSLVLVLMSSYKSLQKIPHDRRTPAEEAAIQVLAAARRVENDD